LPLELAHGDRSFLRALFESQKSRSDFGRVAQQPVAVGQFATVHESPVRSATLWQDQADWKNGAASVFG
jgi:hypothetical protein